MNAQAEKTLLEKLKSLPPSCLDFIDFLKAREERTASRRLGDAFAKLALNATP